MGIGNSKICAESQVALLRSREAPTRHVERKPRVLRPGVNLDPTEIAMMNRRDRRAYKKATARKAD